MLWDGQKISKSLGNVILVEDMLKKGYTPQEIRYVLVSTRYSQRVNFSWQSFDDARKALGYVVEFRRRLQDAAKKPSSADSIDLEKHRRDFEARMDDDLDVAGAIGVLQSFRNDGNRAIDQGLGGEPSRKALELLERFGDVFGILAPAVEDVAPADVVALANARLEARKRIAHRENLVSALARFDLRAHEREQGREVIAEPHEIGARTGHRQVRACVTEDVDRVGAVIG
jgi:cysteinyl-tRNA synthetase